MVRKVNVKYLGNIIEDTAYDEIKKKLKEKGQSEEEASEGAGKILSASHSQKEKAKTEEKKSESPKITTFYSEGEYLSGYMPSGDEKTLKRLEELGITHYVNGWGTKVDEKIIEALGKEFTLEQAEAYAKPILEAKAKKIEEQKQKKQSNRTEKFAEAKRTNKPVVLEQWSEECNDPSEECSTDNITIYAMPDGTTKKTRSHTW